MDTRICVSISDWLVSYTPCDWSYSCKIYHAMLKINTVYCAVVTSKRETKELLSEGWKIFDVFTEIESLEISLHSLENKYICRNSVAKLKKPGSLI